MIEGRIKEAESTRVLHGGPQRTHQRIRLFDVIGSALGPRWHLNTIPKKIRIHGVAEAIVHMSVSNKLSRSHDPAAPLSFVIADENVVKSPSPD
jgi:hypothetical protein